jgi:two-component system, OmpR family, sensor histidine kinase KdpD
MVSHLARKYVAAVLLGVGVTLILWAFREKLTTANISMLYLLTVLIVAVFHGTGPSLLIAFMSFLSFNYFLVKPYYTFLVADPREIIDLFVFLASAALTGQVAAYARKQAEAARERAYEQTVLYELTSRFNRITDITSARQTLQEALASIVSVQQVDILPNTVPQPSSSSADQATLYVLLRADDEKFGVLRVSFDRPPSPSMRQLVRACTNQAAMVIQRIMLSGRAQRSQSFEEADRLKTALLHAVSHDLRTPLTIIKTSASNLLDPRQTPSETERVDMLKIIEHQTDQLNQMVGNLLDLSRLQAGAMPIKQAWNSLEEVAGDVAAEVYVRTKQERVTIDFPEEMPLVSFDYGLILQALANVVENSLRYEPEGSRIRIVGALADSEARVSVQNHGPNVPAGEREAIMEPFYHGQGGNIGLGLAIAKGIIEAHHGRLWVEDTPGGGASFVIALPPGTPPGDIE